MSKSVGSGAIDNSDRFNLLQQRSIYKFWSSTILRTMTFTLAGPKLSQSGFKKRKLKALAQKKYALRFSIRPLDFSLDTRED